MDSKEISKFKQTIDALVKSENGDSDCMYQDVMLSFAKNKTGFPNMKILNELLPTQFPVIIAHKPFNKTPVSEQNTFVIDTIPSDKPTKRPSRGSGDVDGSPLKMQVYADLSAFQTSSFDCTTTDVIFDSEEMKFGIPLAVARKLTGIYNVSSQRDAKNVNTCPSFLCFCDGNDRKRGVCLYTEFLKSPKNEFVGLKSVLVHVMDTVVVDNNEHLPNLCKMDLSGKQIKCRATYDILNDQLGLKDACLYRGSLLLDVTWSRQHSNISLLHVPPAEATTTIKANVVLGSTGMSSAVNGQELSVLKSLIEGLQSSQITWIPNEGQIDIMGLLKGLFENLKLGDAANKIIFEERDNFDFTDHLWQILSKSTSFQELVDSFKYIFKALSNGELQPMVHRGNNTTVAQLVRDSYLGKLRIPNLAGMYPVELLVEIGIEKLRQDYTQAFLSKDLVTRDNLEPFLESEGEYNTHLIQLEKMHSVIEMISMLEFFLKIPDQNLSGLAREMIQHYERNAIAENHIFEFIVPTNSVINYLESCPPSTWQLESAKLVENIKEATTFLLTSNPPFKHLTFKDTKMNTKEDENETNDETTTTDKMKRTYFYVKKTECVSILV